MWNHNIHYHGEILSAVPNNCDTCLDVGCGEGILTRELQSVSQKVVGIDLHEPSLAKARNAGGENIEYHLADLFLHPFQLESFDCICSVAVLHHMDGKQALARMASLLKPGGVLVLVGLAHSSSLGDVLFDTAGFFVTRWYQWLGGKGMWNHSSPLVWPPPESYGTVKRTAEEVLPGAKFRRKILFRYTLLWQKPE